MPSDPTQLKLCNEMDQHDPFDDIYCKDLTPEAHRALMQLRSILGHNSHLGEFSVLIISTHASYIASWQFSTM